MTTPTPEPQPRYLVRHVTHGTNRWWVMLIASDQLVLKCPTKRAGVALVGILSGDFDEARARVFLDDETRAAARSGLDDPIKFAVDTLAHSAFRCCVGKPAWWDTFIAEWKTTHAQRTLQTPS